THRASGTLNHADTWRCGSVEACLKGGRPSSERFSGNDGSNHSHRQASIRGGPSESLESQGTQTGESCLVKCVRAYLNRLRYCPKPSFSKSSLGTNRSEAELMQ